MNFVSLPFTHLDIFPKLGGRQSHEGRRMADILDNTGTEQVGPTGTSRRAGIWNIPWTISIAYPLPLGVIRKVLACVTSDAWGRPFLGPGGCSRREKGEL